MVVVEVKKASTEGPDITVDLGREILLVLPRVKIKTTNNAGGDVFAATAADIRKALLKEGIEEWNFDISFTLAVQELLNSKQVKITSFFNRASDTYVFGLE